MEERILGGLEAMQVGRQECLGPPDGAILDPTPGEPEPCCKPNHGGEAPRPSGSDGNDSKPLGGEEHG